MGVQAGLTGPPQEEDGGIDGPDVEEGLAAASLGDMPVSSQWPQQRLAESPEPPIGRASPPLPPSTTFSAAALYRDADDAFAAHAPPSMVPPEPPSHTADGRQPPLPPSGFARTVSADAVLPNDPFGWEAARGGAYGSGNAPAMPPGPPQQPPPGQTYSQVRCTC